jgi:abortive infection bacteriophage resistance protein
MPYTHCALTIEEQIELLMRKGMVAEQDELKRALRNVSYHRLSGYWHPYKTEVLGGEDWQFRPKTRFEAIWDRYVFDRQVRLLVFDAVERVEVAIRNDLILNLAVEQGPFGYADASNLPNIEVVGPAGNVLFCHATLMANARNAYRRELRNSNPVIVEYSSRYPDCDGLLPYWVLLEIVEFGTLSRIFHGLPAATKSKIAARYGLKKASILDSWLDTVRSARNTSCHQGRFWNRKNVLKPQIPNAKSPEWHYPVDIEPVKDRAFGTLTILKYMLGYIAPQSRWADRLEALFAAHPSIDRSLLGYPDNWRECPIWNRAAGSVAKEQ